MTDSPLASFLLPPGFTRPGRAALLHEARILGEVGRFAVRNADELRRRGVRPARTEPSDDAAPVLLIPGFLAGDSSLLALTTSLRRRGVRTYRSHIRANIGCTLTAAENLEVRLEQIVDRNGMRAQIVGHSLGGMIARGIAARRPDLVSGIVTMGSPMLAPGAHHAALGWGVDALVRLSQIGFPGLMSQECVAGTCARQSFDESRDPVSDDVAFTAIYSRRDGVVDWRACIDPSARAVEVRSSHVGMAVDPRVSDVVAEALRERRAAPAARLRIA